MGPKSLVKTLPCGRTLNHNAYAREDSAELMGTLLQKLDAYTQAKGLNRSEARTQILEVIVQEAPHFRVQELIERVQKRFPEIGNATVYRNIPIFLESALIQEGPTDLDGQVLYELSDDEHHDHIVCLDCKNIFEFHDDAIEKRQTSVAKNLSFTMKDHRHLVYASCDLLKKKK